MPFVVILVLGILAVNVVIWGGLLFWIKRLVNKRLQALKLKYPEREVILMAPTSNLIGLESPSRRVLRGNGTLLLTAKELVFYLWLSDTEIVIPRKSIREIGEVKSFAGKTIFKPLLHVRFRNPDGDIEAMAVYLPEIERWQKTLMRKA